MFTLRGIAVSLTFFVLFYGLLSALVAMGWRALRSLRATDRTLVTLLFALRVFPFVASALLTFLFVVPSFQLLEPHSVDEGMGAMPLVLGVCALLLIAWGCYRVIAAQTETSRVVARWLEGASPLQVDGTCQTLAPTVTFQSRREAPPLTLVGVCKSKVLVSESTVSILTRDELHIALKHELEHMRSRDNLKKLFFRFCPFPGMRKLESAWSQAAELSADDAAVSNQDDAVDLAAALIKLSRLVPVEPAPACTVGFVTGSISARVSRLLAWSEVRKSRPNSFRLWHVAPPLVVAMICAFATYGPALALTHEVTEWLVR